MSRILLTLGSNTFAKTNIDKAKRMLTYLFPNIIFSDPILTEPEDDRYSYLFRNVLAVVDTDMRPEEVISKIKQTERAVGRTPRDKYVGKMVIDIDLVKYGDTILRPKDYEREYVQHLLATMDLPEEDVTPPQPDTHETDVQAAEATDTDTDINETRLQETDPRDVQVAQESPDQPDTNGAKTAETDVQELGDQPDFSRGKTTETDFQESGVQTDPGEIEPDETDAPFDDE